MRDLVLAANLLRHLIMLISKWTEPELIQLTFSSFLMELLA